MVVKEHKIDLRFGKLERTQADESGARVEAG
jgi:hypothetical protein